MKVNSNVFWVERDNKGYFKIGDRVLTLHDLSIDLQRKYWNLVQDHTIEELQEELNDELFSKYMSFLKMIGALYNEKNSWTAYEKENMLNLKNVNATIEEMYIQVRGDEDLVQLAKEILKQDYKVVEEEGQQEKLAVIIARKDNIQTVLKWNVYYSKNNIPFVTVLLKPFTSYIGPFTLPGETPCFNCVYQREKENIFNKSLENEIFEYGFNESREMLPIINVRASISFVATQIMKYVFRKQKNLSAFNIINTVIEFEWLNDRIIEHQVLKSLKCDVCFPKDERNSSDAWLNGN